jgi:polyribonucleotide nucleotidyltransferase
MDFGAFVNFVGKTEGLVHVSEMAAHRVEHPSSMLKEGDIVTVKVIDVDRMGKIKLSMKGLNAELEENSGGDNENPVREPRGEPRDEERRPRNDRRGDRNNRNKRFRSGSNSDYRGDRGGERRERRDGDERRDGGERRERRDDDRRDRNDRGGERRERRDDGERRERDNREGNIKKRRFF